jgi:CheY-like chemotaxis protein
MSAMNVLLVDDDPVWHMVNVRILRDMGFTAIQSAFNGQQALTMLEKLVTPQPEPCVVLTDIEMPVLDGLSFIEAFKKSHDPSVYKVAIAILTTSVNSSHIKKAKELGIRHYLSKPLTPTVAKLVFSSLIPEAIEDLVQSKI